MKAHLIGIALLFAPAGFAQISPTQLLFPSGVISVTGKNNLRLNLVNTGTSGPSVPSCSVKACLVDAAGGTITSSVTTTLPDGTICQGADCPPAPLISVGAGQAASLDYAPALAPGVRQAVLASIVPSNVLNCTRLAATLELSDSTPVGPLCFCLPARSSTVSAL